MPNNNVIYKYNDISCVKSTNSKTLIYLNEDTKISEFAAKVKNVGTNQSFTTIGNYDGAFLYVNLDNSTHITTKGGERDNKEIPVGESVSIPIVFEYFLSEKEKITKRIMFDLRHSLVVNPLNYIIEITANYDNSLQANVYEETISINDPALGE